MVGLNEINVRFTSCRFRNGNFQRTDRRPWILNDLFRWPGLWAMTGRDLDVQYSEREAVQLLRVDWGVLECLRGHVDCSPGASREGLHPLGEI